MEVLFFGADGGFCAVTFFGLKNAGFIDNARELVDDGFAVEFFRISDADEGKVRTFEKLFHIFGVAARSMINIGAVVELHDANWAQGALVTKNEVSGFILDKAVSFVAVLVANLMAEEGIKADAGDDVELLTKNVVEKLETVFFGADH